MSEEEKRLRGEQVGRGQDALFRKSKRMFREERAPKKRCALTIFNRGGGGGVGGVLEEDGVRLPLTFL